MLPDDLAVELTKRFQVRLSRLSTKVGLVTTKAWDELGEWNEPDVERYSVAVMPYLRAASSAAQQVSAGYYQALTRTPSRSVGPIVPPTDLRAPFTAYWHSLTEGNQWVDALTYGRSRAESIAVDHVTSTARLAGDAYTAGTRVVGWRRVLSGKSCTWCSTVATQRYRTAESADFGHDGCDCTVAPIIGSADPGQVINAERLDPAR